MKWTLIFSVYFIIATHADQNISLLIILPNFIIKITILTVNLMSQGSLLDEIKRIKQTSRPPKRHGKQPDVDLKLRKALSQPVVLEQKDNSQQQVSDQSSKERQKQYTFEGFRYWFVGQDLELSNKRIEILTNLIIKRGGRVISGKEVCHGQCDFVICSRRTPKQQVWQNLQSLQKQSAGVSLKRPYVLDYNYLIDCEKQGKILPVSSYQLDSTLVKQQSTMTPLRKLRHVEEDNTDCESELSKQSSFTLKGQSCKQSDLPKLTKKVPIEIKKEYFACQRGTSGLQFSINHYIHDELMKLHALHEGERDIGRKIAYMKAASAIKSLHKQIESEKDISELRGIGKKIVSKVKQLLATGRIEKLQKLKQTEELQVCQQLMRVWGIGPMKAKQLYSMKVLSLSMLQQRSQLLNKNQKIGLKYVEEFQQRIPRSKVEEIVNYVKTKVFEIAQSQSLHIVEACGSYRRGSQSCGDVDIIITRRDGVYEHGLVMDLIEKLEEQGFLTDHLSVPSKKVDQNESISYMGVCLLKQEIHRRIDIKYYPFHHFAFATLYFTGSDLFNRSMRLYARKKGYSLSDRGLVPVQRGQNNEKTWRGLQINLYDEPAIFQFLGLDYKAPNERSL